MIYLIGGTSRSGKTMIAQKMSAQKKISYLSLDWIVMGFTNGIPAYGIHDKLFPKEIAERSWSFLEAMFESMLWSDVNYIIEGEAILPELIVELVKKYPSRLKICFVGYTDVSVAEKVEDIKKFSTGKSDWMINQSDKYITDHVKNMISHSHEIRESCEKHKVKYIDTSTNFIDAIEDTAAYLSK
ncbi:MAG: 2-phosphoglycerate kinase [Cyclobacteriaceae bacterium]|jgi:2-phosphoglycerate kinase